MVHQGLAGRDRQLQRVVGARRQSREGQSPKEGIGGGNAAVGDEVDGRAAAEGLVERLEERGGAAGPGRIAGEREGGQFGAVAFAQLADPLDQQIADGVLAGHLAFRFCDGRL